MTFGISAFIFGFDRGNTSQINPASPFLIEVDAYLSESHTFSARIPDHVVESGSFRNDNILLLPSIINISGIITDTPLLKFDPTQGGLVTPTEGRSLEKIQAILEARDNKELLSLSTTLGVVRNYFPIEFNVPFSPEDGYSAKFTATFKKMRFSTFRFGQKVLNQSQEVSSRSAETNDVGSTRPSSLSI